MRTVGNGKKFNNPDICPNDTKQFKCTLKLQYLALDVQDTRSLQNDLCKVKVTNLCITRRKLKNYSFSDHQYGNKYKLALLKVIQMTQIFLISKYSRNKI